MGKYFAEALQAPAKGEGRQMPGAAMALCWGFYSQGCSRAVA